MINKNFALLKTSLFIGFLILIGLFSGCSEKETAKPRLTIVCGTGLRKAVDKVIAKFEINNNIDIEPVYYGSGIALTYAREHEEVDMFMPGDLWYVNRLEELTKNVEIKRTVSFFVPTIIVKKGNPKKIIQLKDFFRDNVTIAIGNSKACQIGRLTKKIFKKNDMDITKKESKKSLTVNELGVWVKMGDVDATIVWDAIATNIADSVDIIQIPKEKNIISTVVISSLKTSRNKENTKKFIDFITGDTGRSILKSCNYHLDTPYSSTKMEKN
ncbi:MAG: substrate-binding domain-containing protein [Verrucomicrobiota bacterium]|nr:substrate-binding domain-containing protein [Verrucomicrobiota bacterium]